MGIYDREYYRRDGPSFLGSFANRGAICKWLIAVNAVVFVLQLLTRQSGLLEQLLILNVGAVRDWQFWRLLSYAFLHDTASIWHIVFNMLFLWWFGNELEGIYGPREFLAFYLVSAVLGGFAFVVWYFGDWRQSCLGASGAVTAVLVLYAMHFPTRVIYLFLFLPIPIWLFVVAQVVMNVMGLLGGPSETAFSVHLAGAAFGFVYYKMHWRVLNFWPDWSGFRRQQARPNLRVYREEEEEAPMPVAVPPSATADGDDQLEAKLDAVLEKVARSGQGSLTDGERAILIRASEVFKRRRS